MRILIADDHAVVRRGLKQILEEEFSTAIVEDVCDAEQLIQKIMAERWDVVISDLSMPGRSGLDALQEISSGYPHLPILILSNHPEEHYALRVLKAGGSGYLNKESAPEELVMAVQKLLAGKKYISTAVAEKLANNISNSKRHMHESLSNREFDVMKLLAAGRSVSEIADSLSLSITTVSTYRTRVMNKMSLKTNSDLTKYAIENNLM